MTIYQMMLAAAGCSFIRAAEDGGAGAGGSSSGDGASQGGENSGGVDGGAAANAGGASSAADAGQSGSSEAGVSNAADLWKPEGLPEEFLGKDDRETAQKILDGYKALQEKTATGEKAEDYTLKFEGDLAELGAYLPNEMVKRAQESAIKNGIPVAAFQAMVTEVYGDAFKQGLLMRPIDVAFELGKAGKYFGYADGKDGEAQTDARISDLETWANGAAAKLGLSEGSKAQLLSLGAVADGIELLDKLQSVLAGHGISVDGGASEGAGFASRNEVISAMNDPRYKSDPAYRDEVERKARIYHERVAREVERGR